LSNLSVLILSSTRRKEEFVKYAYITLIHYVYCVVHFGLFVYLSALLSVFLANKRVIIPRYFCAPLHRRASHHEHDIRKSYNLASVDCHRHLGWSKKPFSRCDDVFRWTSVRGSEPTHIVRVKFTWCGPYPRRRPNVNRWSHRNVIPLACWITCEKRRLKEDMLLTNDNREKSKSSSRIRSRRC